MYASNPKDVSIHVHYRLGIHTRVCVCCVVCGVCVTYALNGRPSVRGSANASDKNAASAGSGDSSIKLVSVKWSQYL